jgi:hypothetical protein
MTMRHNSSFSRQHLPEVCKSLPPGGLGVADDERELGGRRRPRRRQLPVGVYPQGGDFLPEIPNAKELQIIKSTHPQVVNRAIQLRRNSLVPFSRIRALMNSGIEGDEDGRNCSQTISIVDFVDRCLAGLQHDR